MVIICRKDFKLVSSLYDNETGEQAIKLNKIYFGKLCRRDGKWWFYVDDSQIDDIYSLDLTSVDCGSTLKGAMSMLADLIEEGRWSSFGGYKGVSDILLRYGAKAGQI